MVCNLFAQICSGMSMSKAKSFLTSHPDVGEPKFSRTPLRTFHYTLAYHYQIHLLDATSHTVYHPQRITDTDLPLRYYKLLPHCGNTICLHQRVVARTFDSRAVAGFLKARFLAKFSLFSIYNSLFAPSCIVHSLLAPSRWFQAPIAPLWKFKDSGIPLLSFSILLHLINQYLMVHYHSTSRHILLFLTTRLALSFFFKHRGSFLLLSWLFVVALQQNICPKSCKVFLHALIFHRRHAAYSFSHICPFPNSGSLPMILLNSSSPIYAPTTAHTFNSPQPGASFSRKPLCVCPLCPTTSFEANFIFPSQRIAFFCS